MMRLAVIASLTLASLTLTGCQCGTPLRDWWNQTFYRGDICNPVYQTAPVYSEPATTLPSSQILPPPEAVPTN